MPLTNEEIRVVNNKYKEYLERSFVINLKYYLFHQKCLKVKTSNQDIFENRNFEVFMNKFKTDDDFKVILKKHFYCWTALRDGYKLDDARYRLKPQYNGPIESIENKENYEQHINENDEYDYETEVMAIFDFISRHKKKKNNTFYNEAFDNFKNIYIQYHSCLTKKKVLETFEKGKCHYCGIKKDHIKILLNSYGFNKDFMWNPRGENFELDRKNPDDDYSDNTVVLSCYWCNNAKTDEFTYDEFGKFVASGIKNAWEKRLSNLGYIVELKSDYNKDAE